jgi:ribosome-associated translation inhibitor RaiA
MRYQISGKQIDIGEALQTHVKPNWARWLKNTPSVRPRW